jgi:hypothetical protein
MPIFIKGSITLASVIVKGNYRSQIIENKKQLMESNILEKNIDIRYREGLKG